MDSIGTAARERPAAFAAAARLRSGVPGSPDFVRLIVEAALETAAAEAAAVWVRREPASSSNGDRAWQCAASQSSRRPGVGRDPDPGAGMARLRELADEALDELAAAATAAAGAPVFGRDAERRAIAAVAPGGVVPPILVLAEAESADAATVGGGLGWIGSLIESSLIRHRLSRAAGDVSRFAGCLDLMVALNAERRFVSAAMLLCNELAERFRCDRVSLGWIDRAELRLRALSHTEKFDAKMEACVRLVAAMEEAVDQQEEILWPRPEGARFVARDHGIYASAEEARHVLTVPVVAVGVLAPRRSDAEPGAEGGPADEETEVVGAVTLERHDDAPFTVAEIESLRLIADQVVRPLTALHREDRWFGARLAARARDAGARLVGPERTWLKLLAIVLAAALLVLVFGRKTYRAEATFALDTDSVAFLPAPFDGYLDEVAVEVGDLVEAGDLLFALDDRELLLQRQSALAETERFTGEAVQAEAAGRIAEMRVARARLEQAQADLALVEHRLAAAEVRSPIDGAVIEGDLRERRNAPVKTGDVLMRVAKVEDLYPELEVDERHVRSIEPGASGRLAFASDPKASFAIEVVAVDPIVRPDAEGNRFRVRCRFSGPEGEATPEWWRPGMTGIAKVDAGRRSLLWIATHRTIDWLRLKLF